MGESVDWSLAVSTATRLAPKGPELSRVQAREAVAMLRDLSSEAVEPVRRVTGLDVPGDGRAAVVDRPAWIASNVTGMRVAMGTLLDRVDGREPPAFVRDLGSRGTALQIGAVLAWLSGKVLGQYEVFTDPGEQGRLLLVAPTIVHVEQQLQVPSRDFRLWVCLHEETHRVQFGAVPWLADYLASLVGDFVEASDLGFGQLLKSLTQRAVFDRMTGLMSLLEGHADVVMDEVGPEVIASVALIRERFTKRRSNPSPIDSVARKVLGMDVKLRQYTEGADFVRTVVESVGMSGFNEIWTSPESLPSRAEIKAPELWLARMAG